MPQQTLRSCRLCNVSGRMLEGREDSGTVEALRGLNWRRGGRVKLKRANASSLSNLAKHFEILAGNFEGFTQQDGREF